VLLFLSPGTSARRTAGGACGSVRPHVAEGVSYSLEPLPLIRLCLPSSVAALRAIFSSGGPVPDLPLFANQTGAGRLRQPCFLAPSAPGNSRYPIPSPEPPTQPFPEPPDVPHGANVMEAESRVVVVDPVANRFG
jgi:hypothetical protein